MSFDSETARLRKEHDGLSPLGGSIYAPPTTTTRLSDRPHFPTRASTLGSTQDLNRNNLSVKHDLVPHAYSDDLNHAHSSRPYDSNGIPASLPPPSPAFRSRSRPTTPNGSTPYNLVSYTERNVELRRRDSVISYSSGHSASSSSSSPNKAGPMTSTSSATSTNISQSPCSACGNTMQGAFVRALGTVYHLNCFKCLDCGDVVASKFFPIDGPDGKQHPLCERDYFRRLNLICAKCGLALRGSYITACNKKYHVEHFTCSLCPTLFGPQDSYYEHDGDVYCHFHYSTRFATKCAGCSSAILKQFVEINRNQRDECWHPECYMINKFWNVKVVSRRSSVLINDGSELEPSYVEEEKRETPTTLKDKQVRMEQLVYRIWTVLSAFEESSAACISDMLRQVSNGQYLDAIRMAEKFILHVEVLFGTIDDLECHSARLNLKGMSHVREARMLCRKTVDLFTLLSRTQETGSRRMGMTQELLALVTGIAHYLKILIRIALTGALKLEREQSVREAMPSFLDKLHLLAVQGGDPAARRIIKGGSGEVMRGANIGTQGVTYGFRSLAPENAGESPFSVNSPSRLTVTNPPSDRCIKCTLAVEEDCVRLGTYQRWHSQCLQCARCDRVAATPVPKEPTPPKSPEDKDRDKEKEKSEKDPSKPSSVRRPPANVGIFMYELDSVKDTPSYGEVPTVTLCTDHVHPGCRDGFQAVSRLEQYAFLLNIALRRLYLVLKQQGVVPLSPVASTTPSINPKSGDQDPYRNSGDIMRMKSVHLDRKLSATARLPKRSTIVESPSGKTVQPSEPLHAQRSQQDIKTPQPQRAPPPGTLVPGRQPSQPGPSGIPSQPPSRAQTRTPGTLDTNYQAQVVRSTIGRSDTEVKIVDESAPNSPAGSPDDVPLHTPDDGITLADIPQLMEAAQAREQQRSLPRQSTVPHVAELSALELTIVKHSAVLALQRSPLRDQLELDELLELVETKKGGFWKQLFKAGDKKNVKKKGVFGVPLELLVEKEGSDSLLGACRATLRVPSFIDDVVSAMRQMDMSVEGIFRKNGNIRRLKDLTEAIDHDLSSVDLTQDNPVQLAALLKKFLRELPEPLMTFKLHRLLIASQSLSTEAERRRCLHLVSLLLPKSHRDTMEVLFVFLKWVASFAHMDESTGSKMDLSNLATVICPSILYSRGRDAVRDESFGAIRVVTSLLENQDEFYLVPEEFLPILHDQEYFSNSTELPSKDFMKKCDTYMRLRANGRPPLASMGSPNLANSPRVSPPGDRPQLTSTPIESQPRNGRQQSPHSHPGIIHSPMSYPSPTHPTSLSQGVAMIQNQQQSRYPQPIETDWPTAQRPITGTISSSPRPSSYVHPRSSGEHLHSSSPPNGIPATAAPRR